MVDVWSELTGLTSTIVDAKINTLWLVTNVRLILSFILFVNCKSNGITTKYAVAVVYTMVIFSCTIDRLSKYYLDPNLSEKLIEKIVLWVCLIQ